MAAIRTSAAQRLKEAHREIAQEQLFVASARMHLLKSVIEDIGELAVAFLHGNADTLADLEELGSSPAFMDKLIGVFVADNVTLLAKMESALAARNVAEFRRTRNRWRRSSAPSARPLGCRRWQARHRGRRA